MKEIGNINQLSRDPQLPEKSLATVKLEGSQTLLGKNLRRNTFRTSRYNYRHVIKRDGKC